MLCKKPYRIGVAEFGCGQCAPCRVNRKRMWTLRLVLEAAQHESSLFLTLTYREEDLPLDRSVHPEHARDFLKRLRGRVSPRAVRYFLVGEYGERFGRPHYHVCLFNAYASDPIQECWPYGRVHVGFVTDKSASYCCGYMCKGLTKSDGERQQDLLAGRHPEFARMSLKPGLGAPAMRKWRKL